MRAWGLLLFIAVAASCILAVTIGTLVLHDQFTPKTIAAVMMFLYFSVLMLSRRLARHGADQLYYLGFALTFISILLTLQQTGSLDDPQRLINELSFAIGTTILGAILRAIVVLWWDSKDESDPFNDLVAGASAAANTLRKAAADFGSSLEQSGTTLQGSSSALGKSLEEAGSGTASALAKLSTDFAALTASMEQSVRQVGTSGQTLASGNAELAQAVARATSALGELLAAVTSASDRLQAMRAPGGISADELNRLLEALHPTLAQLRAAVEALNRARGRQSTSGPGPNVPPTGTESGSARRPPTEPPHQRRPWWSFLWPFGDGGGVR